MSSTKYFQLYTVLKTAGATGATPELCAKTLGFAANSVAPYIHALRHKFGAQITSVRAGKTVVGYVLTNADELVDVITEKGKKRGRTKGSTKVKTTVVATKTVTAKKEKVAVAKTKATKTVKAPKVAKVKDKPVFDDGSVAVLDRDLEILECSDRELNDIRSQLGLA